MIFNDLARFNERDLLALSILRSHGATVAESLQVVNAQIDLRVARKANVRKRISFVKAQVRPNIPARHQYKVMASSSIHRQTGRGQAPNAAMAGAEMTAHRVRTVADKAVGQRSMTVGEFGSWAAKYSHVN